MEKQFTHMWAITAHGSSAYLEKCVKSIVNQTVKSKIAIFTATDNKLIRAVARKYDIPVIVRTGEDVLRYNWNFAYNNSDADWVTIAHQDDMYREDYVEKLLKLVENKRDATLFFTDYLPFGGNIKGAMRNRNIQRLIKLPLKIPCLTNKILCKRSILSLGNAICCPTVSYNKSILGQDIYLWGNNDIIKNNIDWELFLKVAEIEGRFVYCPEPLLQYRIHNESVTSSYMENNVRVKEDIYILEQCWPRWIARILILFYKKSYNIY